MKERVTYRAFGFKSGDAVACILAFVAIAIAVGPAFAQTPQQFTVNRVVKYAVGTDKVRAQLNAIPAARAVVAGEFAIGVEDLDDDGSKEIILRPLLPRCKQEPCSLLVLRKSQAGAEILFDRPIPPSGLAVTNEKVGSFRALAAVDSTGQIRSGGRAATEGPQIYAMQGARLPPPTADAKPAKVPAASVPSGRLVGRSISDQDGIDEAFVHAVECSGRAIARHEGSLRGKQFQLVAVSCLFIGGNAEWEALLVVFHDSQQITQAIAFPGSLHLGRFIGAKGDRIVYEATVAKPEDARCCPSGKAIVEIDVDRKIATANPVGFKHRFDPVSGKLLK